jgi:histidinol-phosphate aminotransferase
MDLVKRHPNVVVSRTLSKSFSLAGIRLGIAFAQPDLIAEMFKVKDSYNVSMLTQVVGLAALRDWEAMQANAARICRTRDAVSESLRELGFDVLPSQTNFLLARPPVPAAEMFSALRSGGFLVRYFNHERIRDRIRITVGAESDMAAFIDAVSVILREWPG